MINKKEILKLGFIQIIVWIIYHLQHGFYWYVMQSDRLPHIVKFKLFQFFIPCLIVSSIIILLFFVTIKNIKISYWVFSSFLLSVFITTLLYFIISKASFYFLWNDEYSPVNFQRLTKGFTNHLFLFAILNSTNYLVYYFSSYRKEILEHKNQMMDLKNQAQVFPRKIYIPNKHTSNYIDINTIIYIQADTYISHINTNRNNKITSHISLKKWQERLPGDKFIRIHNSIIVNIDFINKINKQSNQTYKVFLKGIPHSLNMSRRYGKEFMDTHKDLQMQVNQILKN